MKNTLQLLALLLLAAALSNCAALTSAITKQPIPATPVQRAGGPPVNIATADLVQAEAAATSTVWGLYDAGWLAARATQVIGQK